MPSKNPSIEANLTAAKTAAHQMLAEWRKWHSARDQQIKKQCIAKYAAAYTNCKVFLENYLKQLYPQERNMPTNVVHDIRNLVADLDRIDEANETKLNKIFQDIDQLSRHAA